MDWDMRRLLRPFEQRHAILAPSDQNSIMLQSAKKGSPGPFKLLLIVANRNAERGFNFGFVGRGGCHSGEIHERKPRIKGSGQGFGSNIRNDLWRCQPIT